MNNRALQDQDYRLSDTIVICGAPRSGTTWLAEVVNTIPNSAILMEPLHVVHVPEAAEAGFGWRTAIKPGEYKPEATAFLQRVLTGQFRNEWTLSRAGGNQELKPKHWIVKFVRANRMLEWMAAEFRTRRPILLVRHPCAVVASTLQTSWGKGKDYRKIARSWCEDHQGILSLDPKNPWLTVSYEYLVRRPESQFERIFAALDVEVPQEYKMRLQKPSSTTFKGSALARNKDPVAMWRDELPEKISCNILSMAKERGIDFYDKNPEPNPDRFPDS